MKQTIFGYNQQALIEIVDNYNKKLPQDTKKVSFDCSDLVILDWFVYFTPKMEYTVYNDKIYYWLNYSKLVNDLPLIQLSKRGFAERLKKMVELGILSYFLSKENGNKTYYGFGENYSLLIEKSSGGMSLEQQRVCRSNNKGYVVQTTKGMSLKQQRVLLLHNNIDSAIKDNAIIDSSIIDNKEKYEKEAEPMALTTEVVEPKNEVAKQDDINFDEILNHWNSLDIIHHKKMTLKTQKKIRDLIKNDGLTVEDILIFMDRYNITLKDEHYFFKYKWSLEEFITREKGVKEFKDNGGKWLNYLNSPSGKRFEEQETFSNLDMSDWLGKKEC